MSGTATDPRLWILMRSDMVSMNPGKAMAQATHAANAMVHCIKNAKCKDDKALLAKWEKETPEGFGTCIVLDVGTESHLKDTIQDALEIDGTSGNSIFDPSYPIKDGTVTHLVNVRTCGWIFGDANNPELRKILNKYPLHK